MASSTTTTTSTAPSSTTTSTLPEPLCLPGGCDDGNACTEDRCEPSSGCVFAPKQGQEGILCLCQGGVPPACVGEPVPTGVLKRLTRSCDLVERVDVGKGRRARRLLFQAAGVGRTGARFAERAGRRGKVSAECADALRLLFEQLRGRSEQLGGSLTPKD